MQTAGFDELEEVEIFPTRGREPGVPTREIVKVDLIAPVDDPDDVAPTDVIDRLTHITVREFVHARYGREPTRIILTPLIFCTRPRLKKPIIQVIRNFMTDGFRQFIYDGPAEVGSQ